MKALLYCTKGKEKLFVAELFGRKVYGIADKEAYFPNGTLFPDRTFLNGTIVAECEINKIEEIQFYECEDNAWDIDGYCTDTIEDIEEKACLDFEQLYDYIGYDTAYALHLENVKVFDKPKLLSEYSVIKAPQNMQYCYDKQGNKYVLISIRPEHLVNILNGKKTIEVRKKILKEMKGLVK